MGKPGFPMFTLGGVRPGNLQAGDAGTGGVGAGKPRPYAAGPGFSRPEVPGAHPS